MTLDKFVNTKSFLLSDLQLLTYLYKMKNTYLEFAISQKSAARTSTLVVLGVMVELNNQTQILYDSTVLPTYLVAVTLNGNYSGGNRFIKNGGRGFYANNQGKSLEVCCYYYIQRYSKANC